MKKRRKKTRRNKKKLIGILFLVLLFSVFLGLKLTENGKFTVYNYATSEDCGTYKHYIFAKLRMDTIKENDQVIIKNENDKVIALKNAIVNFNTKEVTQNTTYTIKDTNEEGYLNGSYGSDALYIKTSLDGSKVLFMMSGVQGWVDINDIELYYYDAYPQSYYTVSNGSLIHHILLDATSEYYQSIAIGKAPEELQENTAYFSYDGNYFYDDMNTYTNDISEDSHENAINKQAYYNFYQYTPHRSITNVDSSEYNAYLENLGIDSTASVYPCASNESVLYDLQDSFTTIQNETYINASMMFALALNESAYGQSQYAISNYNLFGHAAYDENPDNASSYSSLEDCIYSHAYYFLQQGYANPNDSRYHGSWFGNKASGINVSYASDPYWGEKAASFYYSLDDGNDLNTTNLYTVQLEKDIPIYSDTNGTVLYSYSKGDIVSFIILEENNGYYTIASETPIEDGQINIEAQYTNEDVAYVKINDLKS